jgi:hypothetical protein
LRHRELIFDEKTHMQSEALVDVLAMMIVMLGTCVVGFGLSLLWFRSVGREIDREVISLASKIFGGMFVAGMSVFLAIKFL